MTHEIVFQEKVRTADGMGGWTKEWKDRIDAWAQFDSLSGYERVEAQKLSGQMQHNLLVYYDAKITHRMRIKWHDGDRERILNIRSVTDPNGGRRHMGIIADEDLES